MTVVETKNLEINRSKQRDNRARSVSPLPLDNFKTYYHPDKKFDIKINNLKDESKLDLIKLLIFSGNFTDQES